MSIYSRSVDLKRLNLAWTKVKANKPAAGTDDITWDCFDNNSNAELKQLNCELINNTYQVSPVKIVKIRQGDKLRGISLYTMRDKVVQASIAIELNKLVEPTLSEHTFAYRENRSALEAISQIETEISEGEYCVVCKTDIRNFFDNINHAMLQRMLIDEVKELDFVELIMAQLQTEILNNDGTLSPKQVGIYQGASISPVLSNLYLRRVDHEMTSAEFFYGRYADDIIMLFDSTEKAESTLTKLSGELNNLGLSINAEKTYIRPISDGFDYLGYHFDDSGKSIPNKAETKLEQSLEDVWLSMVGASVEERLVKGSQILNGWEQYYRGEREIGSIYEYAVIVYMMRHKKELENIVTRRVEFTNNNKDICCFLVSVWKENNLMDYVLFEYEQYFGLSDQISHYEEDIFRNEIIETYEQLLVTESEETWNCLMQSYADMECFGCAERISEYVEKAQDKFNADSMIVHSDADKIIYSCEVLNDIHRIFFGREDMYTREYLDINMKRKSEMVAAPLNNEVLKKHLDGEMTVGTYLIRSNDSVKYVVIDVDVIKKALIENPEGLNDYLKDAAEYIVKIKKMISDMGIKSYMEFSGYRGFHLWIFFEEWIALRYVYTFLEMIKRKLGLQENPLMSVEYFPMQNKKKSGHAGQYIKLPFGLHLTSGNRSYFLDDDGAPIDDISDFVKGIARYSSENIKRVIGKYISDEDMKLPCKAKGIVDINYDDLGHISDSVSDVLHGCSLMQYLVNKSMTTGYLTHFERLSVLNVFGHLGEDGQDFVHKVMSYTINYRYNITQGFIARMPGKPISCAKLREQYKLISSEYGCDCKFKRTKNCYPSPVIHALRDNDDNNTEITIPISRTMTKEKSQQFAEELNSANKVEELAANLVELNKQKREINKEIKKIENALGTIFDGMNTDSVEIDMGVLTRRKTGDGVYDWIIDI